MYAQNAKRLSLHKLPKHVNGWFLHNFNKITTLNLQI